MQFVLRPALELNSDEVRRWSEIQSSDSLFDSPYCRPEFTMAVAGVRPDIEVLIFRDAGEIVGFFPFQRTAKNVGLPVGFRLNDFQSVITSCTDYSPVEMLRNARLRAWKFDHLRAGQAAFDRFTAHSDASPYVDLSQGFDAYYQERLKAGTDQVKDGLAKGRKIQRELGELTFAMHDSAEDVLPQLFAWKRAQYQATGMTDVLAHDWVVNLLKDISRREAPEFRGLASSLRVNGKLISISLSMQCHNVIHNWFPAYDPELHRFGPGSALLAEILKEAARQGVSRFDFGKGQEWYKKRWKSGDLIVGEGTVESRPLHRLLRTHELLLAARNLVRNKSWARFPLRVYRAVRDRYAFR